MKKLITILLLVLTMQYAYSQENRSARITVFKGDGETPKPLTKADSAAAIDHSCIKWNYGATARGVLLFSWEFRIAGGLTGEVGLGLTYRDFIYENTHTYKDINGYQVDWSNEGQPAFHLTEHGGLRYYFSGFDNFEGIYGAAFINYRPYSFPNAPEMTEFRLSTIPSYKFLDAQFVVGYQATPFYSDFLYDCYIGFGYRSASLTYITQNYDPNTGQPYGLAATGSEGYPQFIFGMEIGYAF